MFDKIVCTQRIPIDKLIHERAKRTCREMLEDRGYEVYDEQNVQHAIKNELPVLKGRHANEALPLYVFFLDEAKIGIKTVRRIAPLIGEEVERILLVSDEGPTPFTKKELCLTPAIEYMLFKRLCFNYARCDIVPPHRLVSEEEERALRQKFATREDDEWPKLYSTDPIVRYYNFPSGRIVEIERYTGYEPSLYYRMVQ
jgi:DNA-directed RNA polymerase subunit H (RpoH/RPB5)